MTTFRIVLSSPPKNLVVIRQKLRPANFFLGQSKNFLCRVTNDSFLGRNFWFLNQSLRHVLIFNLSPVKVYHISALEVHWKVSWELLLHSDEKIRSIAHIEMNICKIKEVTQKIPILKVNVSQISVRTGRLLVSKILQ